MYIRRSIGDDTFDMGPGAKICIAAANGSTVDIVVDLTDSVNVDSCMTGGGVSVGAGIGSGVVVDVSVGIPVNVTADGITVAVGIISITGSGEGEPVSAIQGGGGTCDGVVPHPARAAHPNSMTRKMM